MYLGKETSLSRRSSAVGPERLSIIIGVCVPVFAILCIILAILLWKIRARKASERRISGDIPEKLRITPYALPTPPKIFQPASSILEPTTPAPTTPPTALTRSPSGANTGDSSAPHYRTWRTAAAVKAFGQSGYYGDRDSTGENGPRLQARSAQSTANDMTDLISLLNSRRVDTTLSPPTTTYELGGKAMRPISVDSLSAPTIVASHSGSKDYQSTMSTPSSSLLWGFFSLHIIGGHILIPILLILSFVRKNVTRNYVFINFCITWILYSITFCFLLYAGEQTGPKPHWNICRTQAALVYAVPIFNLRALTVISATSVAIIFLITVTFEVLIARLLAQRARVENLGNWWKASGFFLRITLFTAYLLLSVAACGLEIAQPSNPVRIIIAACGPLVVFAVFGTNPALYTFSKPNSSTNSYASLRTSRSTDTKRNTAP
ncbi:hypothetical protein FRC15_009186 [Serendipita sp. 397]|nr:hypothetical protein FRC15_009186 [Serendipita sp. 397]